MGGWRAKLIFLLVVYFTGFATAIYCLAPAPNTGFEGDQKQFAACALKSDDFAVAFNSGLHKCVRFGRKAALQTAYFFKEKYHNRRVDMEG